MPDIKITIGVDASVHAPNIQEGRWFEDEGCLYYPLSGKPLQASPGCWVYFIRGGALVPKLGYDDLEIQDGGSASAALETLLLGADALTAAQQRSLRRDLLRYCERDTLGMVRLFERLGKITRGR